MKAVAATLLLACAAARADETCDTIAQCGKLGDAAYKKGDYAAAAQWYRQQVYAYIARDDGGCAREHQQCSEARAPVYYNNVALALLHAGQPLKARAWLAVAPPHASTTHNKALVDQALKDWKWPATPEGEYWAYDDFGGWSTVSVSRTGAAWAIHYEGLSFAGNLDKSAPNEGEFDTEMPEGARKTAYEDAGCTVQIAFAADSVQLKQDGECGSFGQHVDASGTYSRVSITP